MKSFNGRVAAITGAGSGIGRALATRLAHEGCHLALADINATSLAETAAQLSATGVRITTITLNVADEGAVRGWADEVVAQHGGVNLIFNNAGVALSGTVESLSTDDYRWIVDINLWGVIYGTKAFLPHLTAAGEGQVINISSVFGLTAQPLMSGYNATKFAVRGFTESLRQELDLQRSGVSATSVHPGGIKTNVAQAARTNTSVIAFTGRDVAASTTAFERTFITTPDRAAEVILAGVRRNARRVLIGPDARLYDAMARVLPGGYQRLIVGFVRAQRRLARFSRSSATA